MATTVRTSSKVTSTTSYSSTTTSMNNSEASSPMSTTISKIPKTSSITTLTFSTTTVSRKNPSSTNLPIISTIFSTNTFNSSTSETPTPTKIIQTSPMTTKQSSSMIIFSTSDIPIYTSASPSMLAEINKLKLHQLLILIFSALTFFMVTIGAIYCFIKKKKKIASTFCIPFSREKKSKAIDESATEPWETANKFCPPTLFLTECSNHEINLRLIKLKQGKQINTLTFPGDNIVYEFNFADIKKIGTLECKFGIFG